MASKKCLIARSRSSGCRRLTQSSWVSSDAADTLDPSKFRLTLEQGAMGAVAFVRNFFQMLAQPFSGDGLGQDVCRVWRHRDGRPLRAVSHNERGLASGHLAL